MEKVTTETQFCVGKEEYNTPPLKAYIEEDILEYVVNEWLCNGLNSNRFRGGVEWIQTGNG